MKKIKKKLFELVIEIRKFPKKLMNIKVEILVKIHNVKVSLLCEIREKIEI
jgi:hypothetical protein